MKWPNQKFLKKKQCKSCKEIFQPTAPCNHYCSKPCKERGHRDRYLLRNYAITIETFEAMLAEQGGVCAMCLKEGFVMADHHKEKLVVDHCHTNGKVRGLLCHNCNRALGLLQDDAATLLRAVEYLKKGSETIRKE